ncbi:excisionase family DNA-binding protein [Nocardia callitridis]|uniref:Helix-turn-helix domain-containing protein n=1 Tax=Nocardia callitridis TaxID=648753 RepID=A0ABP9L204_9NOCA
MSAHTELTAQRAADVLNVSPPYLVGLLESGDIPYRQTDRHRRIRYGDVKKYRQQSDTESASAADELTRLGQELGA